MERILERIENAVILVTMLIAFALAVAQVTLRYVVNTGAVWIEPTVVSLTVLGCMMGGAKAVMHDAHVRVSVFVDLLPPPLRIFFNVLAALASLTYCGFILYVSASYAQFLADIDATNVDTGLPQWLFGLIAPVSMLCFCLGYLFHLPRVVRGETLERGSQPH